MIKMVSFDSQEVVNFLSFTTNYQECCRYLQTHTFTGEPFRLPEHVGRYKEKTGHCCNDNIAANDRFFFCSGASRQ
jgi:hypothetical protein